MINCKKIIYFGLFFLISVILVSKDKSIDPSDVLLTNNDFVISKLTDNTGYKHFGADSGVDENGDIMIIWAEAKIANQNKLYSRFYNSQTEKWDLSKVLTGQDGNNVYPRIVGGHKGEFFAVWAKGVEPSQKIYFSRYYENKWSTPNLISQARNTNEFPSLVYDHLNEQLIVIWANWPGGRNLDIYIRKYKDGDWQSRENVSNSNDPAGHPEIAVDGNGNIYVTYMQMRRVGSEERQIAYNTNRSGKWLPYSVILTASSPWKFHPTIAASDDGSEVLITWYDYGSHTYRSQYITYDESGKSKWYDIEQVDSGHRIHAMYFTSVGYLIDRFYFFYIGSNLAVYVKEFADGVWSSAMKISDSYNNIYSLATLSPYYGAVTTWTDKTEVYGQVYVAKMLRKGVVIIRILPPSAFTQTGVNIENLFTIKIYNKLEWEHNEENIVDEENNVDKYYVYRVETTEEFNYDEQPYKEFSSSETTFIDYMDYGDNPSDYKYAIVSVDEDGNKSEPLEAQIDNN